MNQAKITVPEPNTQLTKMLEGLDVQQTLAMTVLMKGGTISAAAAAAEVGCNTIYEWLRQGHQFAEVLHAWKVDIAATARTRLLMLTDLATAAVKTALQHGDVRTALRLLERIGIMAAPAVGETHIEAKTRGEQFRNVARQTSQQSLMEMNEFIDAWQPPAETSFELQSVETPRPALDSQ